MWKPTKVHRPALTLMGWAAAVAFASCQDVTVQAVPVESIEVVPEAVTLVQGESRELEARARDADGNLLPGRPMDWSTEDDAVARVDSDGVLEAVGPGTTRVVARSDGARGEAEATVVPRPSIELDTGAVDFAALEGLDNPLPDTVAVRNGGGGTLSGLNREISYPEGAVTGWLDATLTASSAPALLILEPDIEGLVEGEYEASVIVRSSVAENSPREVRVTLSVGEAPPRIGVESTEVTMFASAGATQPAVVLLDVTNEGGGTLTGLEVVGVSYDEGQPTGWLEAIFESPDAPTSLELRANARNLDAGEYGATVTISAPDADNAPVTIDVTFRVSS